MIGGSALRWSSMALRNLARNRRRTLLSLLVVAAGTVALLLTAGFVAFNFRGLEGALVHGGLGHLEVAPAASVAAGRVDRPVTDALADWAALRERLEALPEVVAAGANVHLMGVASTPTGTSASFVAVGVEPDRERAMGFVTRVRGGEGLPSAAPAEGEDVALLARGLAATLGVEPGDAITLLALTPDGSLNALDVRVAGLFTSGVQDLDTRLAKVHLATAHRLLQSEGVSDLLVVLRDDVSLERGRQAVQRAVTGHRPPLAVVDWRARAPFYTQVRNLYLGIFWFLGLVILVLVVLSASNTLLMAVLERTRELGTLRAIGTSRSQVAAIVMLEALWLGLLGGALGCALGWVATLLVNAAHLQMPPPPGAVEPIDVELALVPAAFAGTVALMLTVLALASTVPIARATRLRVAEALTHV
jgi:putative ABC transport system permease protein